MKLKNILEASRFREEEEEDDLYGRPYYHKDYTYNKFDSEDDSEEVSDDMKKERENLCYYLKQMFIGQTKYEVNVEMEKMDIIINIYLDYVENLEDITNIFRITKKIEKEILVMYDGYFEIWYTKKDKATNKSYVMLTFEFSYITDDKKPNVDMHDDDGLPIF